MTNVDEKSRPLSIDVVCAGWFALGLTLMYLILQFESVRQSSFAIYELFGRFVPSLMLMGEKPYYDPVVVKAHAALMMALSPSLFLLFRPNAISNVLGPARTKEKGSLKRLKLLFLGIGVLMFIAGFGARGPGNIFWNNQYAFAILSSGLTCTSVFFLRLYFALPKSNQ